MYKILDLRGDWLKDVKYLVIESLNFVCVRSTLIGYKEFLEIKRKIKYKIFIQHLRKQVVL